MTNEPISEVVIDEAGRLVIRPATAAFDDLYRAGAFGFRWDDGNASLVSPPPKEWGYTRWFEHMLSVIVGEYGVILTPWSDTQWKNVPNNLRAEMEAFASSNWADELARKGHKESADYGRKVQLEQALSHAGQLWDAACYSEYVEELSPYRYQLSPAQLKRLEIAKKRAAPPQ